MDTAKSTTRRACPDCGVSLDGEHHNRKRCQTCATARTREQERSAHHERRIDRNGERCCCRCGVSLEGSKRKRIRCRPCAKDRRLELQRERQQAPDHKEYMKRWAAEHRNMPGAKEREIVLRKRYYRSPGVRDRQLAYAKRPEQRQRQRERQKTPEHKAYMRDYHREYWRRPEVRERQRERDRLGAWDETVTTKAVSEMLIAQRGKCPACEADIRKGYHMDHVEPLARGGKSTLTNLQLLCPGCNLSKHAKDPYEFAREGGRLFI